MVLKKKIYNVYTDVVQKDFLQYFLCSNCNICNLDMYFIRNKESESESESVACKFRLYFP